MQFMRYEDQNGMEDMEKVKKSGLRVFGQKKPDWLTLKTWAWEMGSAEEFPGEEQYEARERHAV